MAGPPRWSLHLFPDPVLVLVQLAPFLVLVAGLHVILFKPMLAYLLEREHHTAGARHEAASLQAKSAGQATRYEQAVAAARSEIIELRSSRRAVANAEYQKVVAAARAEADHEVQGAVERLRAESGTARGELKGNAAALAHDVAAQVLGRPPAQLEA